MKSIALVLYVVFLSGMLVNSTTVFRIKLLENEVNHGAYDKAIVLGEKAIRKEDIERWYQNRTRKIGRRAVINKLLIKSYVAKKQWYGAARAIRDQEKKEFLKLDNAVDNYLLGSYLLAFGVDGEACKYFRIASESDPLLYDASRNLDVCLGRRPAERSVFKPEHARHTIEIPLPNAGFEQEQKEDRTKPADWSYLSSCGIREENPWGLSRQSRTGRHACFLEQVFGKDEWFFAGIARTYSKTPTSSYTLYPNTAYQVSFWASANGDLTVDLFCVEYGIKSGYRIRKLLSAEVSREYKRFISPVTYSGPDAFRFRLAFGLYHQQGKVFIDDVSMQELIF